MKKLLTLLLAGTIALSSAALCGCAGGDKKESSSTDSTKATEAAEYTVDKEAENKATVDELAEIDLRTLHGVSDNIQNEFAGAWQITDGEGSQYKSFVYQFDGDKTAILMMGSVGNISSYEVTAEADDSGNTKKYMTSMMMFGINGKYTYEFSEDGQEVVLTSDEDNKTTTLKRLATYEYIPLPPAEPKVDKNLVGAWSGDDGEMMYFTDSGIMYHVINGIQFYFSVYQADGKTADWSYSYKDNKEENESETYSVSGDTLTWGKFKYHRISPSELV